MGAIEKGFSVQSEKEREGESESRRYITFYFFARRNPSVQLSERALWGIRRSGFDHSHRKAG